MKYYIILAATMLFASCGPNEQESARIKAERDSLLAAITERDSAISDFLVTNEKIEMNLDNIVVRERGITTGMQNKGELSADYKERIKADIIAINDLMNENRKKIDELNNKLKKAGSQNAKYKKMIEVLNDRLAAKDKELAELNRQLEELKLQVGQLETISAGLVAENAEKAQTIESQTTELHTAYYIVGKSKELRDKKIIDKTGGLLGMGKTEKLQADVNSSEFTRIDYTSTMTIPVNSKTAKLITAHPTDAYTLVKDSVSKIITIQITNPAKFWSGSKYLVVVND